jgi:hypothetical protein
MAGTELMRAVIATIRAEAAAQDISLRVLAERSGLKYDRLKGYTARGYEMPLPVAKQLAGGLGMTLADLIRLVEERQERGLSAEDEPPGDDE